MNDFDSNENIQQLNQIWAADQDSQVFARLASSLAKKNEINEALKILINGIKAHPKYLSAYIILGEIYTKIEKYDQAKIAYKKALELDPQNVVAFKGLSTIAFKTGDKMSGIKYLEYIQMVSPFYKDIKETLTKIKAGAIPLEVIKETKEENLTPETISEKTETQPEATIEEIPLTPPPSAVETTEPEEETEIISQEEEQKFEVPPIPPKEEIKETEETEEADSKIKDDEIMDMLQEAQKTGEAVIFSGAEEPTETVEIDEVNKVEPEPPQGIEKSGEAKYMISNDLIISPDEDVEITSIQPKAEQEISKAKEDIPKKEQPKDIIEEMLNEAESIDVDDVIPDFEDVDDSGKKKEKKEVVFTSDEDEAFKPKKDVDVPSLTLPGETKEEPEPIDDAIEDNLGLKSSMDSDIPSLTLPDEITKDKISSSLEDEPIEKLPKSTPLDTFDEDVDSEPEMVSDDINPDPSSNAEIPAELEAPVDIAEKAEIESDERDEFKKEDKDSDAFSDSDEWNKDKAPKKEFGMGPEAAPLAFGEESEDDIAQNVEEDTDESTNDIGEYRIKDEYTIDESQESIEDEGEADTDEIPEAFSPDRKEGTDNAEYTIKDDYDVDEEKTLGTEEKKDDILEEPEPVLPGNQTPETGEKEGFDINGLITRQEFVPPEEEAKDSTESEDSTDNASFDLTGLTQRESFEPVDIQVEGINGLEKREEFASDEDEINTPTLAEIYTDQKHYQKAIDVYLKLIETSTPDEKEKYENKVKELEEKLKDETG
ncbi:tetratricopeptide repeat protein [bacterium]|nr:tetratricopeptide repeat protein [bacterium]